MPDPSQQPCPQPDDGLPEDILSLSNLQARDPEAVERELLPVFDEYCQAQGVTRGLDERDLAIQQWFRRAVLDFLGDADKAEMLFKARNIAVRGIQEWNGREALVLFQELTESDSGRCAVPLEVVRPDDAGLKLPAFWHASPEELFTAPVGLVAKLLPSESSAEIEPVFSAEARKEAFGHAHTLARGLSVILARAHDAPYVTRLSFGSAVVAVMLHAVQESHEKGDLSLPVHVLDGGARPPRLAPELCPIVGLTKLSLDFKPNLHEVGVLTLDPRSAPTRASQDASSPLIAVPLLEKIYTLGLTSEGAFLPSARLIDVRIGQFRKAV